MQSFKIGQRVNVEFKSHKYRRGVVVKVLEGTSAKGVQVVVSGNKTPRWYYAARVTADNGTVIG